MTDDNPVTDEMLRAFGEIMTTYGANECGGYREQYRQAIWAAIKAGGFVSRDQCLQQMMLSRDSERAIWEAKYGPQPKRRIKIEPGQVP